MSSNNDFVETYNTISSSIEALIRNNDMDEKTNRWFIVSYIMQQLAKKSLLKDSINGIDFKRIALSVNDRCGSKMLDFDGKTPKWVYENQ